MKTLQQLFAAILLALALGISVYAGDVQGPTGGAPPPLPPDPHAAVTTSPPHIVIGETAVPPDLIVLALDFLMSALSLH